MHTENAKFIHSRGVKQLKCETCVCKCFVNALKIMFKTQLQQKEHSNNTLLEKI